MEISHGPFFCLCQLCVKNTNLPYDPAILSYGDGISLSLSSSNKMFIIVPSTNSIAVS